MREPSPSGRVVSQVALATPVYAVDLYTKAKYFFEKICCKKNKIITFLNRLWD